MSGQCSLEKTDCILSYIVVANRSKEVIFLLSVTEAAYAILPTPFNLPVQKAVEKTNKSSGGKIKIIRTKKHELE